MRRALALLLAFVLASTAALGAFVTPVAAHGNHVSVDPQVSDDGTVVVESLYSLSGGFLVVHQDQAGQPGRPVGNVTLPQGLHTGFPVQIDAQHWQDHQGNRTYWVVLHRDTDGDGEFDPRVDRPVEGFHGGPVRARVPVRKSDAGSARVLAADVDGQRIDSPSLTVSRVELDRPGTLVVRPIEGGTPGDVVGTRALDPGVHERPTVELDASYFESLAVGDTPRVHVAIYERDGTDGPRSDAPLSVGGDPVATRFAVEKVADAQATTQPLINTPEPTSEPADTSTGTPNASATTADGGSASGAVPGFGVAGALVAALVVVALGRRRGR
ncbi:DUF7282 domain-containing protein [Haloarchaeobius sp. HRN-SO-5]|uniref:DUF7282 domain-containing protein n=1 Tax=Haloarchaeobius sp. HRN-SO-5 TaxID=3446118 RepID=UPI003EC06327